MTPTEFLSARVAHEQWAEETTLAADPDTPPEVAATWSWVKRGRAHREAVRRIITNAERHTPGERGYGAANYAVACLAAVYADHPDYDEAWRP